MSTNRDAVLLDEVLLENLESLARPFADQIDNESCAGRWKDCRKIIDSYCGCDFLMRCR